jgi:hypothetical protein
VVVIPVGPGSAAEALDTLDSVHTWFPADHHVVLVDDRTEDGTWEQLQPAAGDRVHVLRNPRHHGWVGLPHTLGPAFQWAVGQFASPFVVKLDSDALITGPDLVEDIGRFMAANPTVGMFGRHLINVDGTIKSFAMHTDGVRNETAFPEGQRPWWTPICEVAADRGWGRGENVFGGCYVLTTPCVEAMAAAGYLDPDWDTWRSSMSEDVYFTMCTVAAGFERGQFGVPNGPMALAWRGLPCPPSVVLEHGWSVVHSVDKGAFTTAEENGGRTAREIFRAHRRQAG